MSVMSRFKQNPSMYYSMSIAATWAGVGSLMVGIQMAQNYGILPFLLWALGNTLACVLFGLLAPRIPRLRDVFASRMMQVVMGLMSIFQVWINLNGIQTVFIDTPLGGKFGTIFAYAVAAFFILLLIRYGMIRNVLTDNLSWGAVYLLGFMLTVAAILYSRGNMQQLSLGLDHLPAGIEKFLLLLPGPFLYPYFFQLLGYNEKNPDGAQKVNITRAFVTGGLLFGAYLIFTFLLAWTRFSPVLNTVKAVLITLVAVSTVSSFLYSIYITFGRSLGLLVNVACVAFWQLAIPLGVLGVWTLMSSIRIFIVLGSIAVAIMWHLRTQRKEARA